ncbi:unnamed protein product [marine sediment metagenome]|uniref:Hint domain-containing protein n=1 Tax=marine sediment metagenome TaxID=412755 RepID=X1BC03_9ZZZZ
MKKESAPSVRKRLWFTNGRKLRLAVESVELLSESIEPEVYDLHIDHNHEYFADGVLVHNCSDSFDYFITEAFATHFKL